MAVKVSAVGTNRSIISSITSRTDFNVFAVVILLNGWIIKFVIDGVEDGYEIIYRDVLRDLRFLNFRHSRSLDY